MKVSTRGTIAKLKKMARLKENAPIKDRLMAVVYQKKRKVTAGSQTSSVEVNRLFLKASIGIEPMA